MVDGTAFPTSQNSCPLTLRCRNISIENGSLSKTDGNEERLN